MARLAETAYPIPETDFEALRTGDHENERAWVALKELMSKADEVPLDEVVGHVLQYQIADGYAYYLVVDDDPLTIQHVPFGDAWQIPRAMVKGIDRDEVRDNVGGRRRLQEIFGSKGTR